MFVFQLGGFLKVVKAHRHKCCI